MGRRAGFILGLMGLLLPEFLLYTGATGGGYFTNKLFIQGFFYSVKSWIWPLGKYTSRFTELVWLSREWLHPTHWGSPLAFTLYVVSVGLAVLSLLLLLIRARAGAALLLAAGLATLGWMFILYFDARVVYHDETDMLTPLPLGAVVLLGAGLLEFQRVRRILADPHTVVVLGGALLGYYGLRRLYSVLWGTLQGHLGLRRLLFVLFHVLEGALVLLVLVVVMHRYGSDRKREPAFLRWLATFMFYTALAVLCGAYALLIGTRSILGETLFRLSILLFCGSLLLSGVGDHLAKHPRAGKVAVQNQFRG